MSTNQIGSIHIPLQLYAFNNYDVDMPVGEIEYSAQFLSNDVNPLFWHDSWKQVKHYLAAMKRLPALWILR